MRFKPSYLLPVLCAMLVSSTVVAQTIFPLTRADIPKVFDALAPRLQRYQDAHAREEFPARPSYMCRYCPVTSCQHNEVKR